jgi:hypothetical protein
MDNEEEDLFSIINTIVERVCGKENTLTEQEFRDFLKCITEIVEMFDMDNDD